jgi:hypothetical protein
METEPEWKILSSINESFNTRKRFASKAYSKTITVSEETILLNNNNQKKPREKREAEIQKIAKK